TVLFIGSQNVWMLFAARILEGIAYGAFTGTATTFLLSQTSRQHLSTAIKLSGVFVNVGFGMGPAISGLVLQYVQVQPLRMPFWLLLAMLLSSLVFLEMLPSLKEEPKPLNTKISLGIPENIRSHFISFIGLPAFTFFMLGGIVFSVIPSYVKNVIHSSNLSLAGVLVFILLGVAANDPAPAKNRFVSILGRSIVQICGGNRYGRGDCVLD
ncbi:MFS transporter, partial [Priestia megaterium]|uniref:MFS transporter n=1 Tax=Priestia megaterium TaxID=1404 RepID=UPI0036730695